ncbi:TIGR02117 family protein [Antarcticibacterium flavum]|uniref:TIGR02117 family protein n=1 Tax=Antarcticibacterium flavum TaxID=2058175 RepID=A0A5B7X6F5_9FLAO|nr:MULTISPECIES: TIGR02117 family protein [Antarcticibacterium]MCM4159792.1 TIGR02117 family protein [Antarcticibacterium sp. W02-3]QCY70720.1 TIGR02117 family protein [Antarcticibacterium flavum]
MILVLVGAAIPVNHDRDSKDPDLKIYLVSNGMHTDIVVPLRTPMEDWTKTVKPEHTLSNSSKYKYVGFGWGDLGFYANTPRWEDLTLDTGFKALFLKTPAAMHVTFHHTLIVDEDTKVLFITTEEYSKLSHYIKNTFEPDAETGQSQPVAGLHYSHDDVFYKARGSLHLFNTCNTWVNNGLKQAGLEACLWTPFVEGIFYRYP